MNIIYRMAINPDIQLMFEFVSNKYHVMGLNDTQGNLLTFSHVDIFVNTVFIYASLVFSTRK